MDKILRCQHCHSQFYFTEKEQAFYKKKKFNLPKLCPSCRKTKTPQKQHVVKACSTCYFKEHREGAFDAINNRRCFFDFCTYYNKKIKNNAACKNWAKKR